jgi:predicted permease
LAAETVPRLFQVGVDGRILAFSIALAIATSAAFSFTPALRAAKTGPIGGLKEGALNVAGGNDRFRNALVMLQIGLGLILLVVAESFAAGYVNVVRRDPGFRPNGLVAFDIGHSERLSTVAGQISFSESFLERLRQIPGVQEAAMGRPMPLQGHELRLAFDIEGRPTSNTERPRADAAIVTSGFFQAMGIPLLSGRDFTEADRLDTPPVLVVNQAFARKFFPGEDVIGKHIRPGAGNPGEGPPVMREIVGVVGDAKQSLAGDYDPIYYFPFEQLTWGIGTMVLRTTVPPFQIESAAREILADLDPVAPIHRVRTGNQLADAVTAMMRFLVILTGGFAVVALLLAVTGLYGVLSYAVEKRRREIGIRIAVGADRNQVLALVFRQATVMLAVGLVFGLAGAAVSGRVLAAALSGVGTLDWTLLAIACCTMIGAGIAATYIPAVRAATVDPMQALRNE